MRATPVSICRYKVEDDFWGEKMEIVRTKMIPYQWEVLNDRVEGVVPSHCIENFRIAAGLAEGNFEGFVFQDSDVAKWLEAVGYSLIWHPDEELEKTADEVIELIIKTQQPDGYLDTYYIINGLEKRWTNIADNHEFYCAGHMIEAGIAYYEGTGKRRLLDAVIRLADCIDRNFGTGEGKRRAYPGHEILEMALVRLYHTTQEKRYLDLAAYFINERGKEPLYFREEQKKYGNPFFWEKSLLKYKYYQADRPVREQKAAEGHAVRAVYLYSGMAAVARETGDETLQNACEILWKNITERQMYVTGAIGQANCGEAFSFDYDLPNDTVYGETCASIGLVFFARRMLELNRDSRYADVMERAIYNNCISGMSLDGTRFFYVNPLEIWPEACRKDELKRHVETVRQKWFGCACCPPNIARLIASIGKYAATEDEEGINLHLYLGGRIETRIPGLTLHVKSALPWRGQVTVLVEAKEDTFCQVALRIPGWCCGNMQATVNEIPAEQNIDRGYLCIRRVWRDGDTIDLCMDMPVLINHANPNVRENIGKAAISRGPLVYCLEEADNGPNLHRIFLDTQKPVSVQSPGVFPGTVDILADGEILEENGWDQTLYSGVLPGSRSKKQLHFIPYFEWNNRGEGEMLVWVHE